MDFDEDIPAVVPPLTGQPGGWDEYPQNLFPNWTETQVKRCEMLTARPVGESNVSKVDVLRDGSFGNSAPQMATIRDRTSEAEFWDLINRPVSSFAPNFVDIDKVILCRGTRTSACDHFSSRT